jgi:hypothetical protein
MVPLRQVSLEEIEPRIREEAVGLEFTSGAVVGRRVDLTETQRKRDGSEGACPRWSRLCD